MVWPGGAHGSTGSVGSPAASIGGGGACLARHLSSSSGNSRRGHSSSVSSSGACDRYVALLEAFARCPALPAPTRATMRQSITALRQSWRTLPPDARPAVEAACAQGAGTLPQALASLNCTP